MQKKTLLFILAVLLFTTELSYAQWPADSMSNVKICQAANDQKYPEMTSDGQGGAIIVWEDQRSSSPRIYAQRIDSSGVVRWTTNGILISAAENSQLPQIVSDGVGGAIITWFDMRNGGSNSIIGVQRVNAKGDTLWKANGVVLTAAANSWAYPTIAGYGVNGAIITWIGANSEIFAQKVDTSGTIQWTSGGVKLTSDGSLPQIAVDNAGGAIVVWYRYDAEGRYTHVFAQRVSSSGTLLWSATGDTICYAPNYQFYPEVVPDGNGGAIFGWLDNRASPDNYPYAQRVSSTGTQFWVGDGVQLSTTVGYYRTKIASDGSGGVIVTWIGGSANDIYTQRIDGSGTLQWGGGLRLTENTSPTIPRILADGATGAFIVWEHQGTGRVKLQHVLSNGTMSFPAGGKTVAVSSNLSSYFALTTDGKGKAIVAWENTPSYTTDIYAHRVVVPGFTTGVEGEGESKAMPDGFALEQNYPNPFNPLTIIDYRLSIGGAVRLSVIDLLGQEVAVLVNEEKPAGKYAANWDAAGVASGVYLCRLQVGRLVETKKMILLR